MRTRIGGSRHSRLCRRSASGRSRADSDPFRLSSNRFARRLSVRPASAPTCRCCHGPASASTTTPRPPLASRRRFNWRRATRREEPDRQADRRPATMTQRAPQRLSESRSTERTASTAPSLLDVAMRRGSRLDRAVAVSLSLICAGSRRQRRWAARALPAGRWRGCRGGCGACGRPGLSRSATSGCGSVT